MKTCTDCGLDKPQNEFPWRRDSNSYRGYCKICQTIRNSTYWHQNKTRLSSKNRKWRIVNAKELSCRKRVYAKSARGRDVQRKGNRKWYQANKERYGAWSAVKRAVRKGILIKPLFCTKCMRTDLRIDAHHYAGYDKSNWLNIVWLCSACHEWQHSGVNITAGLSDRLV